MARKRAGRMTGVPQLDVPDIFVDDEEDRARGVLQRSTMAAPPSASSRRGSDLLDTPTDARRPSHQSWSSSIDISTYDSASAHPLSFPRSSPSMPGHQPSSSAVSFEVQEPPSPSLEVGSASAGTRGRSSSAVNPSTSQVRGLLDDSVWVESIRRSATIRKSVRKTDWSSRR